MINCECLYDFFFKVMADIPTETKRGLTHVVQMRHLKHSPYSALSLAISFSYLLLDIQHIFAE